MFCSRHTAACALALVLPSAVEKSPKDRMRVPWITFIAAAVAVANPVGLGFLHSAFVSSDQLGRNIAQPIVFSALAIAAGLAFTETLVRAWFATMTSRSK